MQSSLSTMSRLMAAGLVSASTLGSAVIAPLAGAARRLSDLDRYMPGGRTVPRGKKYPFSSTRQHRRNARTQISTEGPNGFTTMQTLPSYLRRTDAEVNMILSGMVNINVGG